MSAEFRVMSEAIEFGESSVFRGIFKVYGRVWSKERRDMRMR